MTNEEYSSVVKELISLNMSLEGHPFDESIGALEEKVSSSQYKIAVVGDFSTGKSTFINALIGEDLLYYSTKEATGVVTTVQYDEKGYAQICKKANQDGDEIVVDEIDLTDEDGKRRLNQYLDIDNHLKIDYVRIFYPIQGIGKDIVFSDTPGIEKMSKEQVLMTRRVMEESNAVIFLITKKGFTEPALKVVSGEHDIIGKIPAKDMMVVMTHIGEIYENRSHNAAKEQIDRIVKKAKQELQSRNIVDIDVFPLDSRDFLWGTNNALYEKEKKKRDVVLNGEMLSQQEYLERSNFDTFKGKLFAFLDRDNLQRSREQDIINTIMLIADAIEAEIKKQNEFGAADNRLLKNQLEKQIELACENQRKFYNRLIRQLQEHMDGFMKNVEKDAEIEEKNNVEELRLIQRLFQHLEDINEENVRKCIIRTIKKVENFALKIENETNEHVKITYDNFVKEMFSRQFQEIFKKTIEVQIEDPHLDLSLVLKKDNYNAESVINDDDLKKMEQDLKEEKQVILTLENQLTALNANVRDNNWFYQKKKSELDIWYEEEKRKLGTRPKARQKYKEVQHKKGILFWKKTWTTKEPDGLDYSLSEEWDRKNNKLINSYEQKLERIEEKAKSIEDNRRKVKKCENAIKQHRSKKVHLEEKIEKFRKYIEDGKKRYTEEYISEKKEDVASYCDSIRKELISQVREEVQGYLYENKKQIENEIKKEMSYQIEKYRNELAEKNRKICERIKVSEETGASLISQITKVKEKVGYGKAI